MARYTATLHTDKPIEETFAYVSDFSTAEEWDPGTVRSERLGDAALGEGTEFRLVASFLHRETTLIYRIVEYDPPHVVTFRGENSTVVSLDRVEFESIAGGTRVLYDAELTLRGVLKLADPLLTLAFNRVGDSALDGMRRALGAKKLVS